MKPTITIPKPLAGFTLIELLVVITIIVVLLALLAPALDKAIYQAELAVCGAQLKTNTTSITAQAVNEKRYYPDLSSVIANSQWQPHQLANGQPADVRQVWRRYLGTSLNKALTDPLERSGAVDLDNARDNTTTWGSYYQFAGWQYSGSNGGPGMKKLGDRWTYRERKYDIITQDLDAVTGTGNQWTSHPDADGVLYLASLQDQSWGSLVSPEAGSADLGPWFTYTVVSWAQLTYSRGLVDMNFAAADCSVQRIDGIAQYMGIEGTAVDERLDMVPVATGGDPSTLAIVPHR